MSDDDRELGEGTGKQGPWAEPDEEHRANKQQGDPHALDVQDDPRGGVQSEEYRRARPTDMVGEGDTTMMGPGGAPPRDRAREADGEADDRSA